MVRKLVLLVLLLSLPVVAQQAQKTYSLKVNPKLTILTPVLADAVVGDLYSLQFTAVGGKTGATYIWSVVGTLPAGLTLTSGGLLSGTPTLEGTYTFDIKVTTGTSSGRITVKLNPKLT